MSWNKRTCPIPVRSKQSHSYFCWHLKRVLRSTVNLPHPTSFVCYNISKIYYNSSYILKGYGDCLMLFLPTSLLTDYMDEKWIAPAVALYKLLSFHVTTSIGSEQFVDSNKGWGSGTKMEPRGAKHNPGVHINILLSQQPGVLLLPKCFFSSTHIHTYGCSLPPNIQTHIQTDEQEIHWRERNGGNQNQNHYCEKI